MFKVPSRKYIKSKFSTLTPIHLETSTTLINQDDTKQFETSKSMGNLGSERSIPEVKFIKDNTSLVVLPHIEEKKIIFQRDLGRQQDKSSVPIRIIKTYKSTSENTSPCFRVQSKQPSQINSVNGTPKSNIMNSNPFEVSSQRKVEFRKSIQIIDFINGVIRKDVIDGSSKPLTKKQFQRRGTRKPE